MLELVCKYHLEWVSVVKRLGAGDYAEDIVQEMYLKLHKYSSYDKCIVDGKVNKYYIFLTLKSILFSYFSERKKILKVNIDDFEIKDEESNLQTEIDYNDFCLKVDEELKNVHWFHKQVFDIYNGVDKTSFRKLEKETNISYISLYNSVKICKDIIKKNLKDDYEKIRNE